MGTQHPAGRGLALAEIPSLIEAAQRGDAVALGKLTEHYRWYLLQAANGEVPDDLRAKVAPSDVVQETFLQVQQGFALFRGSSEEELRAWLRQVLLNNVGQAVRRYRGTEKRNVGREFPLATSAEAIGRDRELPACDETPSRQAVAKERMQLVAGAFERLSESHRQVITLRNSERLSFVEIGSQMQRTPAAVRQLWLRAVEQLRQELEGRYDSSR